MNRPNIFIIVIFLAVSFDVFAKKCDGIDRIKIAIPNDLFDAAVECEELADAVNLMVIAQIRAAVDLSAFPPKSEPDKRIYADLYKRIYGRLGGAGPDQIYRSAELYSELRSRIESWMPSDLLSYEPNWNYSSSPSHEEYLKLIDLAKKSRIKQLDNYYLLLSNDQYYELKMKSEEIWRRNNNQLSKDSEDGRKVREINRQMDEIRRQIYDQK